MFNPNPNPNLHQLLGSLLCVIVLFFLFVCVSVFLHSSLFHFSFLPKWLLFSCSNLCYALLLLLLLFVCSFFFFFFFFFCCFSSTNPWLLIQGLSHYLLLTIRSFLLQQPIAWTLDTHHGFEHRSLQGLKQVYMCVCVCAQPYAAHEYTSREMDKIHRLKTLSMYIYS